MAAAPRAQLARVSPESLIERRPHGDSLLWRMGRGATRAFQPAEDIRLIAENGRWVQHPVTTGRRIAVTGIRGGAGKSTVAALIAKVFARYRQDRVLVMDLDPNLGSLPLRLGIEAGPSLGDLARAGVGMGSFEQVEPYLSPTAERLWALPGSRGSLDDSELDADIYRTAGVPLSRFFGVTVTDSGAGLQSKLHHAALAAAHSQVLVASATSDGVSSAGRALDWMAANGLAELRARTVVVFSVHTPHGPQGTDLGRAAGILAEAGIASATLGFDRHMAMGAALDPGRLAYASKVTAVTVAATAIRLALSA